MTTQGKRLMEVDKSNPNRGRFNRERFDNPLPTKEVRPIVAPEDFEATRQELRELRRRMTPKSA